ncbi:hypothetical protein C1J00_07595 [Streptomyces cahuitamycinicus]|uniref:Uncharacterized protein n=2 Tax=Streptomyces cahuitamycinicus TaxID=2070367 RepID=A0A2N8TUS2_9ACTN|nr:hypothetical protein C1J00_07595 [Streptomyces cahuitamycinicus]
MHAYVMTRGTLRRMDYAFLGQSPPDRWWETVGSWLFLDAEELVVSRRDRRTTGLLLSGIPSQRRDVIGTRIRYTVVVDEVHDDPGLATWLIRCGLEDEARERLGRALDEGYDADYVDAWLAGTGSADSASHDGSPQEVERRLLAAVREGASAAPDDTAGGNDRRGSWAGGIQDPGAREAFRIRALRLLQDSRPGIAFTTHALGTTEGAWRMAQALSLEVAVLLHDSDMARVVSLSQGSAAATAVSGGKAPIPVGRRDASRYRSPQLLILAVTLALAMAWAIWWLTG